MITVDEETLKRARIRALQEDTSVSAALREHLESYAGFRRERREAGRRFPDLALSSAMSSGGKGFPNREELYEERLDR